MSNRVRNAEYDSENESDGGGEEDEQIRPTENHGAYIVHYFMGMIPEMQINKVNESEFAKSIVLENWKKDDKFLQ